MKHTHIMIIAAIPLLMAGCYTHLMSPQEFVRVQRQSSTASSVRPVGYSATSLNYHQPCLNCHSANELDDRYIDLQASNIGTVHDGVRLDPSDWKVPSGVAGNPGGEIYIADPAPFPTAQPYWPRPASPDVPWWSPPVTAGVGGSTGATTTKQPATGRPRPSGPTRDDPANNDRDRPIQTYVPSGPTTPPPASSGTPVLSVQPSTPSSPPASPPPAQNTNTRSRENSGSSSGTHERTSGSSRGNDDTDRPRQ